MLDNYFSDDLVNKWGEEAPELNPHQKESLERGLLDGKNMIVSAPTSSGKTLISEFAFMNTILNQGKKAVYLVPLRSLGSEKYEEFKEKYEKLGIRVALSIGDLDSKDGWLGDYDLIIATSEKMDSLLRHGASWTKDLGLVVVDEIHLLDDSNRGPTLEVTLTKLLQNSDSRVLGLSATIKNSQELADWLNAECIISDYRPVDLSEGIYDGNAIHFEEFKEPLQSDGNNEKVLIEDTLRKGKQALFFVSSRRNAEAAAERLGEAIQKKIKKGEKEKLKEASEKVLNALESSTKQCRRLAKCVKNGSAFHHAGLHYKQKKIVENYFKEGNIKSIAATPTLAAGVNLPAYRVIIRDIKRYYGAKGMDYIPVLEYKQMVGRAGRTKYDSEGQGIIISKSQGEARSLAQRYILGEPEEIYSKLSLEPVLRSHILALVDEREKMSLDDILEFFSETFYGHQYGNVKDIEKKIENVLNYLTENKMLVKVGEEYLTTRIGSRVSQLYLDPQSAVTIMDAIENVNWWTPLTPLITISSCLELKPGVRPRKNEIEDLQADVDYREREIPVPIPETWEWEFEEFLKTYKTALLFEDWIKEKSQDQLLKKYKVPPGELRVKLHLADWLIYSMKELITLSGKKEMINRVQKIRLRMKYGIKEELLPVVKLKGIGRVRSRKLFKAGFRSIKDIREANPKRLQKIVGTKTANKILEQVSGKKEDLKDEKQMTLKKY